MAQQASSQEGQPHQELSPGPAPGHPFEAIEARPEEEEDDQDSALGSDVSTSTASITSSILHYRTIHGRTFHSERGNAQYWGGNDDRQCEVPDILYHANNLTIDGKLFLAPLKKGVQKVVDIGTGTGIWAIDFADEFPDAEVVGTDISPIQPSWVPPNLKFEIEDCSSEWSFRPGSLDYVHMQWLVGSIPDWDELFRQAYRSLKPGGYIESYEPSVMIRSDDGTLKKDSASVRWSEIFMEAGRRSGRSFTVVDDDVQRRGMEAAGFVDIQDQWFRTPEGGWPRDPKLREVGRYQQLAVSQDVEGLLIFVGDLLGWSKEEISVFAAQRRREIMDIKIHKYYVQKVVWGRKPE